MTRRILLRSVPLLLSTVLVVVAQAADIAGTWNMTWDTEGGIRKTIWKVQQDGEAVKVETESQSLSGTIKGDDFKVEGKLHSAEAGYSATVKIEGAVQADGSLKGKGTWDQYFMTFTGTRAK